MALEPAAARIVEMMRSSGFTGLADLGVEGARALVDSQASYSHGPRMHDVREVHTDGDHPVGLRVYRPGPEPTGVLVYMHGGGWVTGSVASHDATCRHLAASSHWVVASVAYRRPPENPFPAAVEDAWAATTWVAAHAEELGRRSDALAVAGDSAGGNLAAVVARLARDHGLELARQILLYPVIDRRLDRPSVLADPDGTESVLNRRDMLWFWEQYDPDGAALEGDPRAVPLAVDDLSGVAPALVVTAEHDPLRDEGEEYAEALRAAGVPTTLTRYPGVFHGFFGMHGLLEGAEQACRQVASVLHDVTVRTATT